MQKKILGTLCLLISNYSLGETANYSLGNSNPFVKYQYKTESQWETVIKEKSNVSYFSPTIINPTFIRNKYKHLIESANEMNGCWDKAASAYHVDPWLLMAIAQVESGFNKHAIGKNTNHSVDLGMMQINSIWLPTLRKYGIDTRNLFEPCTSVFVGAWIVAQNIKHFGYNQDGIGAYNSPGNITIRRNYAKRVYNSYNQLVRDFNPLLVNNN